MSVVLCQSDTMLLAHLLYHSALLGVHVSCLTAERAVVCADFQV